MNRLAQHERIINKLGSSLEVRVQTPEANNVASKLGAAQVAVTDSSGMVRAFCGPASHPETLSDAGLFAAAPTLYEALSLVRDALEDDADDELRADARRLVTKALARVHAQSGEQPN